MIQRSHTTGKALVLAGLVGLLSPCAARSQPPTTFALPTAPAVAPPLSAARSDYLVGAGDTLFIWVWKNPDLSVDVPVRPDGKVGVPLVEDIQAQGRTPNQIAAEVRTKMTGFVQDPVVSVLVKSFSSATNPAAIRVIGAAATPKTVSFRAGITALDVMIEAGGLNVYADGDRARLIRRENDSYATYPLHLKRLIRAGDLRANMTLAPGDVIRIPERWF